jgi:sugar phosphate isomerase/epimerase
MSDHRVPRRTFLAAAAATVAGASLGVSRFGPVAQAAPLPPTGPRAPASPSSVRLGVASYSLRKFPLDKTLEMVKALRTPYVNFKSVHLPYEKSPQELAALRKQIEAAGFQIVGGGTITFDKDTDEDVRRYFEYARAAGMPLMVATGAPTVLPRVEKFARQYDIKVAIHNHGPEDKNFPSPYDVLKHVQGMDPRMGLCIDIGHTVRTGTDVVKAIGDAGPRLLDMHVKDLRDLKAKESQCIVGEGELPIADIFRALDAIHYPGFVNLEYEIDADDPLPGMKQSFAYMRGVLAGLAPAGARTASAGG